VLVAAADLDWFELDDEAARVLALVDGRRTIEEIAHRLGAKVGDMQLQVADLRAMGVVAVD
jgi:hypothetical protein